MIEHLRNDDVIQKVGGRFKLTALVQKRWLELMRGARPLVKNTAGKTEMEIVMEEILQDKVGIDYEASNIAPPSQR
ncbi:MAG: DNA-directed RNA polymerase subunit omega [Phycisphaerales bacterium]|nr:DNA-directed RNA polymerase subunit omega [Phycisphaerales bacterium]